VANESLMTTTEIYDRQGRIYQVSEQSGPGGAMEATTYAYSPVGELSSVTSAGAEATQSRTFTYDGRGFLTSEWVPEKGASTAAGGAVTYRYDGAGHTLQRTDGSRNLTFVYDRAERLKSVTDANYGQVLKSFTYDAYNGSSWPGKLAQAVRHNYLAPLGDVTVTENYEYLGKAGRISRRDTIFPNNGISFWQTFSYDDLGHITSMQYPSCGSGCGLSGPTVSFQYANGLLNAIPNWASSITYNNNGTVNQVTFSNGARWTQTADSTGMQRPASISGDAWSSGTYLYDGSGNIAAMGADYALYDLVGRVTDASSGGTANHQQYTYDSFGNITQEKTYRNGGLTGTADFYVNSARNRATLYQYDDSGNVTSDHFRYSYDALGMMTNLNDLGYNNVYFAYTADDERVWSYDTTRGSFWHIRDLSGNMLGEFLSSDNTPEGVQSIKNYVYRDGVLVGSGSGATPSLFYYVDHLGTPRATLGVNGGVLGTRNYFAFGENVSLSPPCDGETIGFAAKEKDANFIDCSGNTYNFHAREYSPPLGRFLSTDPVNGNPFLPQSWNKYAYVGNNPINVIDPYGLFWDPDFMKAYAGMDVCGNASGCGDWFFGWSGQGNDSKVPRAGSRDVADKAPSPKEPKRSNRPCNPLAPTKAGTRPTFIDIYVRVTHPLELTAANAGIFLGAGAQFAGAGIAYIGGCLDPTVFEPLTCLAGSFGGSILFGGSVATAAWGADFFNKQTLPAIENWGCDEE